MTNDAYFEQKEKTLNNAEKILKQVGIIYIAYFLYSLAEAAYIYIQSDYKDFVFGGGVFAAIAGFLMLRRNFASGATFGCLVAACTIAVMIVTATGIVLMTSPRFLIDFTQLHTSEALFRVGRAALMFAAFLWCYSRLISQPMTEAFIVQGRTPPRYFKVFAAIVILGILTVSLATRVLKGEEAQKAMSIAQSQSPDATLYFVQSVDMTLVDDRKNFNAVIIAKKDGALADIPVSWTEENTPRYDAFSGNE